MSSALSNALTLCQKKTTDIALSISRATSHVSTKTVAWVATQKLSAFAPLRVFADAAYGCAVFQLGVSDLLQCHSVPRGRSLLFIRGGNSLW